MSKARDLSRVPNQEGAGKVGYTPAGVGAVERSVESKLREWVSVKDFGAVGDGVTNDTAAIQAAIDTSKQVYVPDGDYRTDSPVYVTGACCLRLSRGATLHRNSAYSASTLPVVYVLDSYSELRGGRILTDNASPDGAVVLGHLNNSDNRNVWNWRFLDVDVQGNNSTGSIGWAIPSGQVTYPSIVNYFGTVSNINTKGFDIGCKLFELANAHNCNNLHFWQCKTANISLRGAYANNFNNMFFHGGTQNGCVGIQILDRLLGTDHHSSSNTFTGWTCETGGASDLAFTVGDNCTDNTLIGHSNVGGGWIIGNYSNTLMVSGLTISLGKSSKVTGIPFGTATAITPLGLLGIANSGAALITVNIYNSAQPNFNRSDLVLVSCRSGDFAGSGITVVDSAFLNTGINGEPVSVVYDVTFPSGNSSPVLTANITSAGSVPGTTFTAQCEIVKP